MAEKQGGKKSKPPDTRPGKLRYNAEKRSEHNKARRAETHARRLENAALRRLARIEAGDKPKRLPHPDPEEAAKGKTVRGRRPSEVQASVDYKRTRRRERKEMTPMQRAEFRTQGERQFLGKNPNHNRRHGRPVPTVQVETGGSDV